MLRAVDPTNGRVIREVEPDSEAEVERKLDAAVLALQGWRRASFDDRAEVLRAVASLMRDDIDRLGGLMTEEMGKPVREARGEVQKSAWCADHYAAHAAAYLATEHIDSDATRSYVQNLPLGPVLGILPWNAPFWLAFRFLAPALMAGNAALVKHDPHVPGCAMALPDLFERAGAPPGLVQALMLPTPRVEAALRDPRVRAVSFTGSSGGGAKVAAIAASLIKPAVLELGGSDPAIVLADADLDVAVEAIATMRIINAGQSCIAAKRVLVEAPVYERFVERFAARLRAYRVGDPRDEKTDVGPLARPDLRDALHAQVQGTIDQGATCHFGGEVPEGPGFFYPVTLLTGVHRDMTAFREETFGPVAAVTRVADVDEAIARANDTDYGLGASVFTDAARGERLARDIESGQVAVNGVVKTDPRLPSGGVKGSGYGRELGPHGIRMFVNAQQVWVGPRRD